MGIELSVVIPAYNEAARIVEISELPEPVGAGFGRQPLVKLDAGGATLLAQITRKSLATLELRPGLPVYAVIKGMALLMQA